MVVAILTGYILAYLVMLWLRTVRCGSGVVDYMHLEEYQRSRRTADVWVARGQMLELMISSFDHDRAHKTTLYLWWVEGLLVPPMLVESDFPGLRGPLEPKHVRPWRFSHGRYTRRCPWNWLATILKETNNEHNDQHSPG